MVQSRNIVFFLYRNEDNLSNYVFLFVSSVVVLAVFGDLLRDFFGA
jgi:hypothetical protein